jgi:hypothetical protein
MLEAKDTELLAALRKTALLTEELNSLRQQQQQQLGFPHTQQQQQQGRVSSSSAAFNAACSMGSEGLGLVQGADEGSSTPSRQDGALTGLTAAAYCSQQLLTGLTASEPGTGYLGLKFGV